MCRFLCKQQFLLPASIHLIKYIIFSYTNKGIKNYNFGTCEVNVNEAFVQPMSGESINCGNLIKNLNTFCLAPHIT